MSRKIAAGVALLLVAGCGGPTAESRTRAAEVLIVAKSDTLRFRKVYFARTDYQTYVWSADGFSVQIANRYITELRVSAEAQP